MGKIDVSDKEFLTAKEAAAYLRVSLDTLYRLCRRKKGRPPFRQFNNGSGHSSPIKFPTEDFVRWAKQGE